MFSKILGIIIIMIYSKFKVETAEEKIDLSFVVSFIYKDTFPATALCSGVILTEKLILSAAYPIAVVPKGQHCVLPGFDQLHNVTEDVITINCIDIDGFHRAKSDVNLVIARLNRSIFFNWDISTAPFIIPKDLENFSYSHSCLVPGWKYKKAISAPGVFLTHLATELTTHEVTIEGVEQQYAILTPRYGFSEFYLCNAHIGMPLLCDYFVVGIVANDNLNGNIYCKNYSYFTYTNIMTAEIQNYLKEVIPVVFNLKEYLDKP